MQINENELLAVANLLNFLSKKIICALDSDDPEHVILELGDLSEMLSVDNKQINQHTN